MTFCPHCGQRLAEWRTAAERDTRLPKLEESDWAAPQNTSGQGRSAILPEALRGWNWGAFFFGWLWGVFNSTWIALLAATPYVGIVMHVVLGVKGNEWAWANKRWDSIEHFKRTQTNWGVAALVALVIGVIILVTFLLS